MAGANVVAGADAATEIPKVEDLKTQLAAAEEKAVEEFDFDEPEDGKSVMISDADDKSGGGEAGAEEDAAEEDTRGEEEEKETPDGAEPEGETIPDVDEALLSEAEEAGLTREQATALAKGGHLEDVVEAFTRKVAKVGMAEVSGKGEDEPEKQEPPEPKPAPDEAAKAAKVDFEKLVEAGYDAEIVNALKAVSSAHEAEVKQLRERLEEFQTSTQQANAEAYAAEFDGRIEELGKEWEETFGKGDGNKLNRDGDTFKNRVKLNEAMAQIEIGRERMQLPEVDEAELFKRALRMEFGDKIEGQARKKLSGQLRNQRGRVTSRPARHKGKPAESADEAALAGIKATMTDRGLEAGEPEENDPSLFQWE